MRQYCSFVTAIIEEQGFRLETDTQCGLRWVPRGGEGGIRVDERRAREKNVKCVFSVFNARGLVAEARKLGRPDLTTDLRH